MISIQNFFALLTVSLMISGCSQKPPPGSTWKPRSATNLNSNINQNNSNSTQPVTAPVVNQGPPPEIGIESSNPTKYIVIPNAAVDFTVKLKGEDAVRVFLVSKILAKTEERNTVETITKAGKRLVCDRTMLDTTCFLRLRADNGDIDVVNEKVNPFHADIVLKKKYKDEFVNIDPAGPFGAFYVSSSQSKIIYEALPMSELPLPGKDFFQKRGKRVICTRDGPGTKDSTTYYKCTFYINFGNGDVDEIQDPSAPSKSENGGSGKKGSTQSGQGGTQTPGGSGATGTSLGGGGPEGAPMGGPQGTEMGGPQSQSQDGQPQIPRGQIMESAPTPESQPTSPQMPVQSGVAPENSQMSPYPDAGSPIPSKGPVQGNDNLTPETAPIGPYGVLVGTGFRAG